MTNPYGKILTGVGLLEGGKLSKAGRDAYIDEVVGLLVTGNENGKGGIFSTKIFNTLVPLPPIPGPAIPNVTTLETEPVFWFKPDPLAAILAEQLKNPTPGSFWHIIFPDILYSSTAAALDANGSTPLFPIFDVTCAFPDLKGFPILLPELAIKSNLMPLPRLMAKLADLGIELKVPVPPIPPIPPSLPFPDFSLPGIPFPGLPSLALPDLLLGLIKLPFDLIIKLVAPPNLSLVLDLPGLPKNIFGLAFDIFLKLIEPLLLIVPKVFLASLLIYLKNIVAMVCVDVVGMLVGAGGAMTKQVASLTGLI